MVVPAANLFLVPDRDPRMLPGATANTLTKICSTILAISGGSLLVAIVGLGLVRVVVDVNTSMVGMIAAIVGMSLLGFFVLTLAAGIPFGVRASHVHKAELAAGYTTLLKQFDQVDGIDSKTGQVVRPARARPVGAPALDTITTGIELGVLDGIPTPLQLVMRVRLALPSFVLSVLIFAACIVVLTPDFDDNDGPNGGALVLFVVALIIVFVSGLAILMIPSMLFSIVPGRQYLAILVERFPTAHVVVGTIQEPDVLDELFAVDAARLPDSGDRGTDYLVFGASRVDLYSRHKTELVPFLSIPRSRIARSELTFISQSRGPTLPAALFTLTKDDGGTTPLTLSFNAPAGPTTKKKVQVVCDWVLDWANGGTQ